ncbi:MAG: hypothetical protein J7497_01305 [Chitinophagaceae bacterium]|nr:hypothetical protein [Chitinophagaceae bacterium]
MKKVKIMLMAIAIFAVTGAALAFKASKTYNAPICYTTNENLVSCPLLRCPNEIQTTSEEINPIETVCTTIPQGEFDCLVAPDGPGKFCAGQVTTIFEEN